MHEERLFRELRAELIRIGAAERADRFSRVRLWVGALAHLDEARLRGAWPDVIRGTPAEGSRLDVVVSADLADPRAQGIVLTSVDVPRDRYLSSDPGGA